MKNLLHSTLNFIQRNPCIFVAIFMLCGLILFADNTCMATSTNAFSGKGLGTGDTMSITWPWTRFLNSLADQLTGPLPLILGAMGIVAAAIAMFAGHGGAGTQKFITLIFAISICMFAPTFISYLQTSASGATIMEVLTP
jgi:type IV secretory pathway VirB2 component (pilin)